MSHVAVSGRVGECVSLSCRRCVFPHLSLTIQFVAGHCPNPTSLTKDMKGLSSRPATFPSLHHMEKAAVSMFILRTSAGCIPKIHVESALTAAERGVREERHFVRQTLLHLYLHNVDMEEARTLGTARGRTQVASLSTHGSHCKKREYISETRCLKVMKSIMAQQCPR